MFAKRLNIIYSRDGDAVGGITHGLVIFVTRFSLSSLLVHFIVHLRENNLKALRTHTRTH